MASCLTKNVMVFGSAPTGGMSIHLEHRVNLVSNIRIQHLIDVFSEYPDLAAQTQKLEAFLKDLSFGQDSAGTDTDSAPNFTLSMSKSEIASFADKCRDKGIFRLGTAILGEWLPLGIDRLHFNCSNTRCYY